MDCLKFKFSQLGSKLKIIFLLSLLSLSFGDVYAQCPTILEFEAGIGSPYDEGDCLINTGGNEIIITGDVVIVSGTYTFNNGIQNFTIASGGNVTIQSGTVIDMANDGETTIDDGGEMTIDDGGTFTGANNRTFFVNGVLNISGDVTTDGNGTVGDFEVFGANAVVTVSGPNGSLVVDDDLQVYNGARFEVESGGNVQVDDNIVNGSTGTGGTISPGTIIINGSVNVDGDLLIFDTTPDSGIGGTGTITVDGNVTIEEPSDFLPDCTSAGCAGIIGTGAILPVDLTYFIANSAIKSIELKWETTSEINNDYFNIERSSNGVGWDMIAQVDGHGNSNTTLSYEYIDYQPIAGTSYYRLKQTDFDGAYEYFEAVSVNSLSSAAIALYPNPATNELKLNFKEIESSSISIQSVSGQMVNLDHSRNGSELIFNTSSLSRGIYLITISQPEQVIPKRFSKH